MNWSQNFLLVAGILLLLGSTDVLRGITKPILEKHTPAEQMDIDQGRSHGGNVHVAFCTS